MQNAKQLIDTLETMIPYYHEKGFGLKLAVKMAVDDAIKIDRGQMTVVQSIVEGN